MSYDLMVFDPDAAPAHGEAFLAWYDSHSDETELFDPTRFEFSTPKLRSWLDEMMKHSLPGTVRTLDAFHADRYTKYDYFSE